MNVAESAVGQGGRMRLSRQVTNSIIRLIAEKKLGPGDVLPTELQIAEQLQVSKSSVREAIKMLEALGVVEIRRGLNTIISENPQRGYLNVMMTHLYLNSGTLEELRVFRRTFEAAYTSLALEMADQKDLEAIGQALEQFRAALEAGRLTVEDDIRFHSRILTATHNSFLISLGNALNELFREAIGVSLHTNPEIALHDHEKIYQAIVDRNPVAAVEAIGKSADQWAESLRIEPDGIYQ